MRAPLEFTNSVGWPLTEGLFLVHNALTGFGVRDRVKLIASGKIATGFHMAKLMALGADLFQAARPMMFSIGCIQARRCHSNECPVGVATQNPHLERGLVVEDKVRRVANFQEDTVKAFLELIGAAGLAHPSELTPHHILRRVAPTRVESYHVLYDWLEPGSLLGDDPPDLWRGMLARSRSLPEIAV